MKGLITVVLIMVLAGCASMPNLDRAQAPGLFAALDSQPDGYTGDTADGVYQFEIISTRSDGTRLCRVVNLESDNRFHTESYCKIRGGEWQ